MIKLISRLFSLLIAATAVVATVLLFTLSPLSFNSKVVVDVATISKAIPETDYTKNINAKDLLGTEEIQVGVKFTMSLDDISKAKAGDKEVMNDRLLKENLDGVLETLDNAIDVLADNTIRTALKSSITEEIKKQIENARPKNPDAPTTEQIMTALDVGDQYFRGFTSALYAEANRNGATADSVSTVLLEQTGEVMMRAEKGGYIKSSAFTDEQKNAVKDGLDKILGQLNMKNDDGTIKHISDLPYIYAINFVQKELTGKVDASELAQRSGESLRQQSDRLLELYVFDLMPTTFYTIVSYISLGILIAVFVLAGIWLLLAAYEVLSFLFPKAKFRLIKLVLVPLFFIASIVQIGLGFVLTGVFKYVLPKSLDIASLGVPVKEVILVPRTFALGTSIVVIITIGLLMVGFVLKKIAYGNKAE